MAWGLMEPSGFGEFSPKGSFQGWNKQCETHFLSITSTSEVSELRLKGNQAYLHKAISELQYEASTKFDGSDGRLETYEQPKEFRTARAHVNLSSLLDFGSLYFVDIQLKGLIEEFEPGIHQFWPIKISMPKNREYPIPYFGMVILQHLDTFIPEQSQFVRYDEEPDSYWGAHKGAQYSGLSFSKSAIGKAHLWREKRISFPGTFISDALQTEIQERELRIFRHYKVREV